jgi:hypothetical protein
VSRSESSSAVGSTRLTMEFIDRVNKMNFIIPSWVLTTFNDFLVNMTLTDNGLVVPPYIYTNNRTLNTELMVISNKSSDIIENVKKIKFGLGWDDAERVTQGNILVSQPF